MSPSLLKHRSFRLALAAFATLATFSQLEARTFTDNFDRADGTTIGRDWQQRGDSKIANKVLVISPDYSRGMGGIELILNSIKEHKTQSAKLDFSANFLLDSKYLKDPATQPRWGLIFNWDNNNNYDRYFYTNQTLFFTSIRDGQVAGSQKFEVKRKLKPDQWYQLKVSSIKPGEYELSIAEVGEHTTNIEKQKVTCTMPGSIDLFAGIAAANEGPAMDLQFDNFSFTTTP